MTDLRHISWIYWLNRWLYNPLVNGKMSGIFVEEKNGALERKRRLVVYGKTQED